MKDTIPTVSASRVRVGGAGPWLMWSVAALFFAYGFFARVAPSIMVEDLMRDFAASGAIVGTLSAFYFYAYAGMQIPIGVALDRWGPRRMMALAAVVCGIGSILFGIAETLPVAYVGRLLIGGGSACAMIGTLKLASIWFPPNRFALVFGLTAAIGCAGAVAGQGPMASLVEVVGWREVQLGGGALSIVCAFLIWGIVRDRTDGGAAVAMPGAGLLDGLKRVLRNGQSWVLAFINAFMVAPLLSFGALWGVPYMKMAYGLTLPQAGLAASMMLIGHGFGAPVLGWMSDRIGLRKPILIVGTLIALLSFAAVIYAPGLPVMVAYLLLLVYGAMSSGSSIVYATAKENNPIECTGVTSGFVNMTTMGTSAVFQAVLGWILDLRWDGVEHAGARIYSVGAYQTAMTALIVTSAIAFILSFLVRETHCRSLDSSIQGSRKG